MIVKIKFIDPDGDFLVLSLLSEKNANSEIFIDKQAFRFTSLKFQSVILAKMIDTIQFVKVDNGLPDSELSIFVREDSEWNNKIGKERAADLKLWEKDLSNTFTKYIGVMSTINEQVQFKNFLKKINIRITEKNR